MTARSCGGHRGLGSLQPLPLHDDGWEVKPWRLLNAFLYVHLSIYLSFRVFRSFCISLSLCIPSTHLLFSFCLSSNFLSYILFFKSVIIFPFPPPIPFPPYQFLSLSPLAVTSYPSYLFLSLPLPILSHPPSSYLFLSLPIPSLSLTLPSPCHLRPPTRLPKGFYSIEIKLSHNYSHQPL